MADQVSPGGIKRGETAADHFTIVSNLAARDPDLYLADRGLLVDILSHKSGFVITEESLAARCRDGIKTVRACLKRLMERGYLYRGERTRYPRGYRNKDGKDIGGALGPYVYYATDKLDDIAAILHERARVERERLAAVLAAEQGPVVDPADVDPKSAGQDNRPVGTVVDSEVAGQPAENPRPAAVEAGSPDLQESKIIAGGDNRPSTTGVKGRTKEDQRKKTNQEDQGADGADAGAAGAPAALRLAGPDVSTATTVVGPDPAQTAKGDHRVRNARARSVPVPPAAPVRRHRGLTWKQVRNRPRTSEDEAKRQDARAQLDAVRSGGAVPADEVRERLRRVAATPPRPQSGAAGSSPK